MFVLNAMYKNEMYEIKTLTLTCMVNNHSYENLLHEIFNIIL